MAEVKIKFSAETAEAQKQLEELNKTGERIKKQLADGGSGNRRADLEQLRAAKEQLAAAEAEKKEIQEKIRLQAQNVKEAERAVSATAAGSQEHKAATRELEKQRSIMENMKNLGKVKGQAADSALANVGLARQAARQSGSVAPVITPKVNDGPAKRAFNSIRNAASSTVSRIKSGFASASAGIGKAFTGAKAVAGAALAYIGLNSCKQVINELDNLSKHARSLDIDTASFQKLKYAADSNNISFEQVESSIGKMKRTIGEAANGSPEAAKKLAAIGLSVKDLKGKSTTEQFDMIAKAITSIQDPAQRTAASMKWFEEGGAKMIDFLRNYKSAGEDLAARGAIIDDAQLKAAEEFNQCLTNISTTLLGLTVNTGLLSKLTEIVKLIDFAASGKGKQIENSAAEKGVYNRKTGTEFVLNEMEKSGKYSPEQMKQLRNAGRFYASGTHPKRFTGEYDILDSELKAREMGALARQKGKWYQRRLVFNIDAIASPKQTKEERQAEAEKLRQENEKRRRQAAEAAAKAEAAKKAQEAEAAKKAQEAKAAKETERQTKINSEISDLERKYKLQQMINQGKGKEAAIEEQLHRARKQAESLGTTLSAEQEERIRKVAGESYDLSHPEKSPAASSSNPKKLPDVSVITNSLTSRGGFAGGAVVRYDRAIANQTKRSSDLLSEISRKFSNLAG